MMPAIAVLLATASIMASPRPPQLGLCASCHTESGCSRIAGTPHLAAQDETYLRQALAAYRSGARDHAAMRALAGALSVRDIGALASWYSTLPACTAPGVAP